jgi:hypothetical protein
LPVVFVCLLLVCVRVDNQQIDAFEPYYALVGVIWGEPMAGYVFWFPCQGVVTSLNLNSAWKRISEEILTAIAAK